MAAPSSPALHCFKCFLCCAGRRRAIRTRCAHALRTSSICCWAGAWSPTCRTAPGTPTRGRSCALTLLCCFASGHGLQQAHCQVSFSSPCLCVPRHDTKRFTSPAESLIDRICSMAHHTSSCPQHLCFLSMAGVARSASFAETFLSFGDAWRGHSKLSETLARRLAADMVACAGKPLPSCGLDGVSWHRL